MPTIPGEMSKSKRIGRITSEDRKTPASFAVVQPGGRELASQISFLPGRRWRRVFHEVTGQAKGRLVGAITFRPTSLALPMSFSEDFPLLTTVALEKAFCKSGQKKIITVLVGLSVVGSSYVGNGAYTLTNLVREQKQKNVETAKKTGSLERRRLEKTLSDQQMAGQAHRVFRTKEARCREGSSSDKGGEPTISALIYHDCVPLGVISKNDQIPYISTFLAILGLPAEQLINFDPFQITGEPGAKMESYLTYVQSLQNAFQKNSRGLEFCRKATAGSRKAVKKIWARIRRREGLTTAWDNRTPYQIFRHQRGIAQYWSDEDLADIIGIRTANSSVDTEETLV
ncbi:hypothetical protein ARMSODRAFT_979215 [Armillaria solidipes]|uniref:Uncharacterized protein n=1 Tax=Armillaria solidipes TaxID=1076256 RepID=A0A2H3B0G7_9AGAR|nr:hypothetical protein ARMSODRAFT_979215 [Armillaria solidipes]